MNCPLCGESMDETGHCPNCGGAASLPAQEEKRRDDSTLRSGVGIFYENLAVSQAEAEQEHRPPRPARYSSGERKGIVFSVALLLAILGTVFWGCSGYDPDAAAIRGENGITMDNRTFSIYFYAAMSEAQSQYGQDGGTVPFDPTGNLERQYIDLDTGYTWADYFREQALQDAALTESLIWQAQEKGFRPSAEKQEAFQGSLDRLPAMAAASGYPGKDGKGDLSAYLTARYGPGMTVECYQAYLRDTFLAQSYSDMLYQNQTYSEEALRQYYMAHSGDYQETPMSELPNVDIRQILYLKDGEGQAAMDEAVARAQRDQAELEAAGGSEQAFCALAQEISADGGSRDDGGLLRNIAPGTLGNQFSDWCFDPAGHSYGDMGIAKSSYGVHLIFFLDYRENYQWKDQVTEDMRSEALGTAFAALLEQTDCRLTRFALAPPMGRAS